MSYCPKCGQKEESTAHICHGPKGTLFVEKDLGVGIPNYLSLRPYGPELERIATALERIADTLQGKSTITTSWSIEEAPDEPAE